MSYWKKMHTGYLTAPTCTLILRKQEQAAIQSEICGKVFVIFDGTIHVCEALAIILRFVDEQYKMQHAVRVTSKEVVLQLIVCLLTELEIKLHVDLLIAVMRDYACKTRVVVRTLSIFLP